VPNDLVQATITQLYVHWARARSADHIDAYARTVMVREFLTERRSAWARRVNLDGRVPETSSRVTDHDALLDLRAALTKVPRRQRATLVLRFYCDLNVEQAARVLGCTAGTVKSQTSKGLESLRRALLPAGTPGLGTAGLGTAGITGPDNEGDRKKADHG
jgi:RNA polymerase sigma factor (sigma-70 family)